jgi:putative endopeptidase
MKNTKLFKVFIFTTPLIVGCKTTENQQYTENQNLSDSVYHAEPSTISISNLDRSIKPYDDFFQFSNGTWVKNNPVPASESSW